MAPNMAHLPEGCAFAPRCPRVAGTCRATAPEVEEIGAGHALRCFRPLEREGAA